MDQTVTLLIQRVKLKNISKKENVSALKRQNSTILSFAKYYSVWKEVEK